MQITTSDHHVSKILLGLKSLNRRRPNERVLKTLRLRFIISQDQANKCIYKQKNFHNFKDVQCSTQLLDAKALFEDFIFRRLCSDVIGRRFLSPVTNRIPFEVILYNTILFSRLLNCSRSAICIQNTGENACLSGHCYSKPHLNL